MVAMSPLPRRPSPRKRASALRWAGVWLGWLTACSSIPRGQYGVRDVTIEGAEQLAGAAIERCLLTMERDRFGLVLGVSSAGCRVPPFDRSPPRLSLWSWPWTDWPTLNQAVLEIDRQRIE